VLVTAYVYIRGEYYKWQEMLQKAIDDAYAKKFIGKKYTGGTFFFGGYLYSPRSRSNIYAEKNRLDELNRRQKRISAG